MHLKKNENYVLEQFVPDQRRLKQFSDRIYRTRLYK